MRTLVYTIIGLSLLGCSTTTKTVITPHLDAFVCEANAGYWEESSLDIGGAKTAYTCRQSAKSYCEQNSGQKLIILSEKFTNSGPARPSSATVTFKCVSDKDLLEKDQKYCMTLGFKLNTDEMANCILKVQLQRQDN